MAQPQFLLAFALLLISCSTLWAQSGTFIQRIGVDSVATHQDLLALPNGDLVMTGQFGANNVGFLARFDPLGQLLWGGTLPPGIRFDRLVNGSGDSFYACGTRDTTLTGDDAFALVGYFDGQGNNAWQKLYDDGESHLRTSAKRLGNGNLLFAAVQDVSGGAYDYVAAIDSQGQVVWEDRLPGSFGISVADWGPSGALVGRFVGPNDVSQLTKLDATGAEVWSKEIGVRLEEVESMSDSLIYLGCLFAGVSDASMLVKLDTAGQILEALDFTSQLAIRHFGFTPEGNLLLSGEMLVDPQFGLHWQASYGIYRPASQTFGLEGWAIHLGLGMSSLIQAADGDLVVALTDESYMHPEIRFERRDTLMHTTCDSLTIPSSMPQPNFASQGPSSVAISAPNPVRILPTLVLTPTSLDIHVDCAPVIVQVDEAVAPISIYPNPAAESVRITLPSPSATQAHVELWNNLGQKVHEADDEGSAFDFDVRDLPMGFYRVLWHVHEGYRGSATLLISR